MDRCPRVHEILPDALNHAFVEGMEAFGKKIHGFNGDEDFSGRNRKPDLFSGTDSSYGIRHNRLPLRGYTPAEREPDMQVGSHQLPWMEFL